METIVKDLIIKKDAEALLELHLKEINYFLEGLKTPLITNKKPFVDHLLLALDEVDLSYSEKALNNFILTVIINSYPHCVENPTRLIVYSERAALLTLLKNNL